MSWEFFTAPKQPGEMITAEDVGELFKAFEERRDVYRGITGQSSLPPISIPPLATAKTDASGLPEIHEAIMSIASVYYFEDSAGSPTLYSAQSGNYKTERDLFWVSGNELGYSESLMDSIHPSIGSLLHGGLLSAAYFNICRRAIQRMFMLANNWTISGEVRLGSSSVSREAAVADHDAGIDNTSSSVPVTRAQRTSTSWLVSSTRMLLSGSANSSLPAGSLLRGYGTVNTITPLNGPTDYTTEFGVGGTGITLDYDSDGLKLSFDFGPFSGGETLSGSLQTASWLDGSLCPDPNPDPNGISARNGRIEFLLSQPRFALPGFSFM